MTYFDKTFVAITEDRDFFFTTMGAEVPSINRLSLPMDRTLRALLTWLREGEFLGRGESETRILVRGGVIYFPKTA